MDKGSLRSGQPDDHLRASIALADEAARALADQLYDFNRTRDGTSTSELLCQAAAASADQVAGLAGAIVPSLAPSIARAWEWLKRFRLGLGDLTVGELAVEENRSLWLRDLLRELARFDLPSHPDNALRWLAVYCGAHAQETASEITALISKLLGRGYYHSGTTGCDHLGRLLACEIAHASPVAEDLLDTLKLIGTGRHPALPAEKQFVPSPHVARGLAGCGREDAVEILCDTITTDRQSPELSLKAALQAAVAAVEVLSASSTALVRVLETIAMEISHGTLDRNALSEPLSSVLALPAPFLADPSCDVTLQKCAAALNDANLRALMINSDDETDMFLGLWALSVLDLDICGKQLRERYEQACAAEREDTKLALRTFARLRATRTLAMRPIWLCMLSEALGDSRDSLNLALTAEVLAFKTAAGLNTGKGISVPADTALDLLLELERRLRDPVLKEELVKVSGAGTAYTIDSTLASLIVANLAGRSVDCLLPLASNLDYVGFPLLADADFTKSNAQIRAIVFERAGSRLPIGSRMMIRAVAAAESIDELVQWSRRFEKHSVDPLFALSCALRSDRVDFWRAFLSASKKPHRECGLRILIATLRFFDKTQLLEHSKILSSLSADIVIDSAAIRLDAAKVLDEYEAAQSAKKKGDDLKSHYARAARELARSEVEADLEVAGQRAALVKLCEQVAQITGIDAHRFTPTAPQKPRDHGTTYADLLGRAAPKIFQAAGMLVAEARAQSLAHDEQSRRLSEWFATRPSELRESDGSEVRRLLNWFWSTDSWPTFEKEILCRAQPLMQPNELKRIAELSPPAIESSTRSRLHDWERTLRANATHDYTAGLLPRIDWYESILANLPASIQQLGPLANSPVPHPPHHSVVDYTFRHVCDYLRTPNLEPATKSLIHKRLWPLLWWTASFGGKVQAIDASAIGHALSHDQVTLYELVWFLVLPEYRDIADNLISGVQKPERLCMGINAARDVEIRAVIQAVSEICRRQENSVDPSLPPTLANTWRKLPAPPSQATVVDALQKYAQTPYQVIGSTDDSQKAFVARLREALSSETDTWLLPSEGQSFEIYKALDFDKVDAWQKSTRQALKELLAHKTISEEQLLRVAMHQPLLLRSVLEATGRTKLLEAAIWLTVHLGWGTAELAMTLDADTGHASLRRLSANAKQLAHHLVAHYVPDFTAQLEPFAPWLEKLTIRRSWKQAAIDGLTRQELKPLFDALKAVHTAADRQRVEGWIAAMDGKLSSPVQREKLEASIKDRPNAALLQLALLPLPSDRAAMLVDISRRLKIIEAITIAGRKCKSVDARENVKRAVDRVRCTLADNAGLAGPVQLDWLSGEAIAKELAEFKRIEIDDYVIALQLRGDGPHCVVSKGGKALKALPAALKSSEQGKRLIELQNRLKNALGDTRAVLEAAMLEQRGYTPDDLKMMLQHPVVATLARELLFVMSAPQPSDKLLVGRPSDDGQNLLSLDGKSTKVTQPVRIVHPLDLDEQGVLAQWQSWFTDHAPQPFPQVERAFARLGDLEIIDDGTRINRHDGVAISNEEQAFRVLQAHGWQSDREASDICRIFRGGERGDTTAILQEFLIDASLVGPIEFRDSLWNIMPIVDVPPIILSETIRDIDRTIEAVRK